MTAFHKGDHVMGCTGDMAGIGGIVTHDAGSYVIVQFDAVDGTTMYEPDDGRIRLANRGPGPGAGR